MKGKIGPTSPIPSRGHLTQRFKEDDQRLRNLMLEHQSMVFSIALRILGDRSSAEEAAQDVFLELHVSWPSWIQTRMSFTGCAA